MNRVNIFALTAESSGRDTPEVPQRMAVSMLIFLLPEDFGTPWDSLCD